MPRMVKGVKWWSSVIALQLIMLTLFSAQPVIIRAAGSGSYPDCLGPANGATPVAPSLASLTNCYQPVLNKFSLKFLHDLISWLAFPPYTLVTASKILINLQQMSGANQQPSIAQLAIQMKKGDPYQWERQELTQVDQGSIDSQVLHNYDNYDAAVDQPLLDQLIKQQLPITSNHNLDQLFTHLILATRSYIPQTYTTQACKVQPPTHNPHPRVDPSQFNAFNHEGDASYHGGHVVDGITNIYLIFWGDSAFQPVNPKYVSLMMQFVKDLGQSPLYAILMQYTDANGRCPTGARLAGTFIDTRPFPPDMVAKCKDPNLQSDQNIQTTLGQLAGQAWRKEIADVAANKGWNTRDYHNFFVILPTMGMPGATGYHSVLPMYGSPFLYVIYPSYVYHSQGQCIPLPPNQHTITNIPTSILSHEIMETIADPQLNGWDEIADKCTLLPDTIDPKTRGDVTWNGHVYAVQEEYDNYRHGCVLEGP